MPVRADAKAREELPLHSFDLSHALTCHWRICSFLLGYHNTNLPVIVITCLVDEIKNAGGSAEPFCTVFERPDAVRLRQSSHEALD